MQILQDRIDPASIGIRIARPDDAYQVAELYRKVYGDEYPCPELFTEEGMREFLTFERSHTITSIVRLDGAVVASGTFQIHGRVAYSRGWMVDPAWQGKIGTRQVFQRLLLQARYNLAGKVDYFYGELRTATAKLQGIIEEIGFRPLAALPRKDIFEGKREVEIIFAYYYREPRPAHLRLTPRAARVASAVLQQQVAAVRVFVPPSGFTAESDHIINYNEESNGDGHLHVALPDGASLDAIVCPASRNSEKVAVYATSIGDYASLLQSYLAQVKARRLDYAEVYVAADAPARQAILEDLGFSPTGFLPQWYAVNSHHPIDYIVYTIHFPSSFPDRLPEMTTFGQYLRPFITPPIVDASEALPAPEFERRLASIQKAV